MAVKESVTARKDVFSKRKHGRCLGSGNVEFELLRATVKALSATCGEQGR